MDYKEQLDQLTLELSNAETPEQLNQAEFKIKKLKMQQELMNMKAAVENKEVAGNILEPEYEPAQANSEPVSVSGLVMKYGLDSKSKILSVISEKTGLSLDESERVLNMYTEQGIDGDLNISHVPESPDVGDWDNHKNSYSKKKIASRSSGRRVILIPGLIILAVLIVVLIMTYSSIGFLSATPDYPNEASLESALNYGADPSGSTVQITVNKLVPDSAFGYNIQTGEHLNFCSASNPKVKEGDTLIVEVKDVQSVLGSYIIAYEKVSKLKLIMDNFNM